MLCRDLFHIGQTIPREEFSNKLIYNFMVSNHKKNNVNVALMKYDNGNISEQLKAYYIEDCNNVIIKDIEYKHHKYNFKSILRYVVRYAPITIAAVISLLYTYNKLIELLIYRI